jgi:hypothetical protein
MENDRLRRFVESAVRETLLQHATRALRGQPVGDIETSINTALNESMSVPAFAIHFDEDGKAVLVVDPGTLLGKTAAELRASGFVVSAGVPDCAVVTRNPENSLIFAWKRIAAQL